MCVAEDILEVVERLGGAQFMRMLSTSGLDRELQDMDNFTVLLPSNDAIEVLLLSRYYHHSISHNLL